MANKYPEGSKKPKQEPQRKQCAAQRALEDKSLELKIFNYLRENLSIRFDEVKGEQGIKLKTVTITLRNPITGAFEEIEREYL